MIPAFIADRVNRKRRGELDNENRVGAYVGPNDLDDDLFDQFDIDNLDDDDDDDDDEEVLECKGSSPPPAPSPMEEAQAQMELERQRAALEQQAAERARQQEAAERQARIDKARGVQTQAYNSALDYGNQQVGARGYNSGLADQYGLLDLYTSAIDNARMGIQEDDLNPMASYNTRTAFNDALETALGTYRGDLTRQLNDVTGENFGYNTFADTADDSILQSILDQGRADSMAQIDQARARGQLNDAGYNRALTGLDTQGESAMADLQDLGLGVLSGYRDQLGSLRSGALDNIGKTDFSNPFDFGSYNERVGNTVNDLTGRMRGDIFRATEGQSFFDPSTIISSAGALQGFYNPTSAPTTPGADPSNPLLNAFTDDAAKKNQKPQGNTNGVF